MLSTFSHQCQLCDNARKRSPVICRKSRASCIVSRSLSLNRLHVLNRDVNMIQTNKLIIGLDKHVFSKRISSYVLCRMWDYSIVPVEIIVHTDSKAWPDSQQVAFLWHNPNTCLNVGHRELAMFTLTLDTIVRLTSSNIHFPLKETHWKKANILVTAPAV